MKFDPVIKPETVVSRDVTRSHLCHVYFDAAKQVLAATDGHRLIVAPVAESSLDDAGFVPTDAFKRARQLAKQHKGTQPEISLNGSAGLLDGSTLPRPPDSALFPKYARVIPTGPVRASVGISAKYLASVFAAVGDKYVVMHIRGDLDPIVFEAPSDYGTVTMVVMPARK